MFSRNVKVRDAKELKIRGEIHIEFSYECFSSYRETYSLWDYFLKKSTKSLLCNNDSFLYFPGIDEDFPHSIFRLINQGHSCRWQ